MRDQAGPVDRHGGVADASLVAPLLQQAGHDHHVVRAGDLGECAHERAVERLRVGYERLVERVDEVAGVLREDDHAGATSGCRRHELCDGLEVRRRVGRRGELRDRDREGVGHCGSPFVRRRTRMMAGATSQSTRISSASGISAHQARRTVEDDVEDERHDADDQHRHRQQRGDQGDVAVADDRRLRALLEENAMQRHGGERHDRAERRQHHEPEVDDALGSERSANAGWKARASRKPVRICVPVWRTRSSCRTSFQLRSARSVGRLVAAVGAVILRVGIAVAGHALILVARHASTATRTPRVHEHSKPVLGYSLCRGVEQLGSSLGS